ncbi:MAG: OmpA family protein, partial [Saprospiraceae bacterium]
MVFGRETANAETAPSTNATGASYLEVDTENVFYGFNKVHLSYEDKANLNRYVDWVKSDPSITLKVEARTDDIGSSLVNIRVSQRRANIVAEYLVNKGVPSDKVQAVGLGEENPLFDNVNSENRRLNRRTTIKVVRKIVRTTSTVNVSSPAAPSDLRNVQLPSAAPASQTISKKIVSAPKEIPTPQPLAATSAPERKVVTRVMNPAPPKEIMEVEKPVVKASKAIVEVRSNFTAIPRDVHRVVSKRTAAAKPVTKVASPSPKAAVEAPKPIVREVVKPSPKPIVAKAKPAPKVVEKKKVTPEVKLIKNSRLIQFIDAETGEPV